jgi:hypothetical protein
VRLLVAMLFVAMLAGCAGNSGSDSVVIDSTPRLPALEGFKGLAVADLPTFSEALLVDPVRAGGEPVIAILPSGTILISAHPGWTHYHPSSPTRPGLEILTPASGQSYLWRSTDGGATFQHVGLPMTDVGPRGTAPGVSDPEFTVMADGTACYTDLEALAAASVACSTDDGQTWLLGNPLASGKPVDRQWLASHGDELYFTANYMATPDIVRASKDRGLTWEDRGRRPCAQDLVADPATGFLVVGCGAGIGVSEDGGRTWSEARNVPNVQSGGARVMAEPGIDSSGNVWVVWAEGELGLHVAGTPDFGMSWPWRFAIAPHFELASLRLCGLDCPDTAAGGANADASDPTDGSGDQAEGNASKGIDGTYVWPWLSAGSTGRMAVSWIGTFGAVRSVEHTGPWYVFSAYILDATTDQPTVVINRLTPQPIHHGPICQSGTICQVSSMQGADRGDRRLGDFFETTIDAEGYLHAAWSNTARQPDDVISHPEYVRQIGGIRLIEDGLLGSFMPTQG